MDQAGEDATTVVFSPLRFQRDEAVGTITRAAASNGLRIDTVEERPRRLTVELLVRISGHPEDVRRFCKETKGRDLAQIDRGGFSWDALAALFRELHHILDKL